MNTTIHPTHPFDLVLARACQWPLVIFKYPLYPGLAKLSVPVDFRILAIHEQKGRAFVWIEHQEPQMETKMCQIQIVARGTGERWDPEHTGTYIDSAFDIHGGLVFHFYRL